MGRKLTNTQTHSPECCFCIFPLVIPFPLLPSHACLVFLLHFPLAFHILIHYSLCPLAQPLGLTLLPCRILGEYEEMLVCVDVCLRKCATFVCIVLYLYAETDSQSSKACHHRSGLLAVFLSGKSFVT